MFQKICYKHNEFKDIQSQDIFGGEIKKKKRRENQEKNVSLIFLKQLCKQIDTSYNGKGKFNKTMIF